MCRRYTYIFIYIFDNFFSICAANTLILEYRLLEVKLLCGEINILSLFFLHLYSAFCLPWNPCLFQCPIGIILFSSRNFMVLAFMNRPIIHQELHFDMKWGRSSVSFFFHHKYFQLLQQGSPTPRPWPGTGLRPVRNWAAQQEMSGLWASEASSAAPCGSPSLALRPEPSRPPPRHPCRLWKNCLPRNRSLVAKRLGTAVLQYLLFKRV